MNELFIETVDKKQQYICVWDNYEGALQGVIQIVHGMAEHAIRYDGFAKKLNAAGFIVYVADLRGHGKTRDASGEKLYFAKKQGWQLLIDDIHRVNQLIVERHPNTKLYLFGHSMGSFAVRTYICYYGENLSGVIISGTAGNPGFTGIIGKQLIKAKILLQGDRHISHMIDKLFFGDYSKLVGSHRTAYDWLSTMPEEVDKYILDPYCGAIGTLGFYKDLISGILAVNTDIAFSSIRQDLPMLLISGDSDPVGKMGLGVKEVYEKIINHGVCKAKLILYHGSRHELLNDKDRLQVTADIIQWLSNN
ncbi:MAG: alpha/beta hydrolase [Clostridia bacterium]